MHRRRSIAAATDDAWNSLACETGDAQRGEGLRGRLLLGGLLGRAAPRAELLAVDQRGADEPALVRRPADLEHLVVDGAPRARERLLELRLRVDVPRARVLDPLVERLDDRGRDDVEAVLEIDRGDRRLSSAASTLRLNEMRLSSGPGTSWARATSRAPRSRSARPRRSSAARRRAP